MAKMKIAAGILSALALCLAACTVDGPESDTRSVAARICAGVGTRADGANWTQDEIGVTVAGSESSTSTMPSDYRNVPYVTEADGEKEATFKAVSAEIYFDGPSETTFTAYAPYEETASLSTLPGNEGVITRSTAEYQKDRTKIDFLFASGKTASSSSPTVNFVFDHRMSQIILNISAGNMNPENTSLVSTADYLLSGLTHQGTFNVTTGEAQIAADAEPVSEWSLSDYADKAELKDDEGTVTGLSYTIVIYPQTPTGGLTLSAAIAGLSYDGTLSLPSDDGFVAGYSYTYSIVVNETKLEVTGCTITKWLDPETDDWGTYGPMGSYVYTDDEFQMIFNSTPTLGTSGQICFYDYDTDELVDYINIADVVSENGSPTKISSSTSYTFNTAMDAIYAYPYSEAGDRVRYRPVHFKPVTVDEPSNTVTIRHHFGVLEHDTKYYITVDAACLSDSDGKFEGIGKKEWIVVTKPAPEEGTTEVSVGKYGYDVDFRTVQGGLSYVVGNTTYGSSTPATVNVHEGTYEEFIGITYMSGHLTIKSVDGDGLAVITQASTDALNEGTGASNATKPQFGESCKLTGGRAVFYTQSCNYLEFDGMTIENTYEEENNLPSAEAVYFNNDDSRFLLCKNCTFRGHHSVVETKGYNWFYKCTVEGSTSAVWGYPTCALFDECELRSVGCQTETNKSVCESRTKSGNLGFCFLNCDITASAEVESDSKSVLAGITAQKTDTYDGYDEDGNAADLYYMDNMAFVNCNVETGRFNGWGVSTVENSDPDADVEYIYPAVPTRATEDGWKYYNFIGYTIPESGSTAYTSARWNYAYEITDVEPDYEYTNWFSDRNKIFEKFGAGYNSGKSPDGSEWETYFSGNADD